MGVAVSIVMALATLVTYALYEYLMVPLGIAFLEIIVFIFVIASLVQMLEMIIKKLSPSLYNAMGIYLPSSRPTAPFWASRRWSSAI